MAKKIEKPKEQPSKNPPKTPQESLGVASQTKENMLADVYTGAAEETFYKSPMVPESYQMPYNSDDLWQKTGDYTIYEDMVNDDQISICLNLTKDLVLGSGFDIISEEEGQEEIIKDIEVALNERYEGDSFIEDIEDILTAYEFGFSLTEKIFKVEEGKLRLKELRTRHPNSWLIFQDAKGSITQFQQNTSEGFKDIDKKALIHFSVGKRFKNPYGNSDLRAAYAAWFAKRQIIRYYAIFLEKSASPIPVAKYDKNAPKDTPQKLRDILSTFQNKTNIVIPKEIEIEFLESSKNGDSYSKAIDIFNMFIGRSLFVPDLIGLTGSSTGGGSYALGKEQITVFFNHIKKRQAAIEEAINKHIIKPLVIFNHGFVEKFPKLKFRPISDDYAVELAKIWLDAVKGKTFQPNEEEINHFRKMVKFPEGIVEFVAPPPSPFGGAPKPGMEDDDEEEMEDNSKEKKNEVDKLKEQEDEKKKFALGPVPKGTYYKKVNFKQIKTKLDDYDNSIMADAQPIIKRIYNDLYDQLQKKKIIESKKVDKLDTIKLKYLKDLKQVLKYSFIQLYKDAQSQANSELEKGRFAGPVVGDEFMDLLDQETFDYIGKFQYIILENTKQEIIAAIKDGKSLSSVIDILDNQGKDLSEVSLERYARTKHTEVMNKGRLELFSSSGVVVAYQYSAILDDRTSDICRGLDGKIFKAGNEPVPPLHFNCRSLLIPITKYEEWTEDEKVGRENIDDFIEENKGKGFSTK